MSNYLFTLRGQTVKAKDETGLSKAPLDMALFSFVSGNIDSWSGPSRHEKACEALAEKAWEKHAVDGTVPFVVTGDKEDVAELRAGNGETFMTVYRGCTNSRWVDCSNFPAAGVYGLLVKSGNRLAVRSVHVTVSPEGKSAGTTFGGGIGIPITGTRTEIVGDMAQETMHQYALPSGKRVWVAMGDKEAMECLKEDWAPVWEQKKAEKAKQDALAQQRREMVGVLDAHKTVAKTEQELVKKLTEVREKKAKIAVHYRELKGKYEEAEVAA